MISSEQSQATNQSIDETSATGNSMASSRRRTFGFAGIFLLALMVVGLLGHVGVATSIMTFMEEKISWEKRLSILNEELNTKQQQLTKVEQTLNQKLPTAQDIETKLTKLDNTINVKTRELAALEES